MQAQITKAVLSQALLFGIKDALEACASSRPSPLPPRAPADSLALPTQTQSSRSSPLPGSAGLRSGSRASERARKRERQPASAGGPVRLDTFVHSLPQPPRVMYCDSLDHDDVAEGAREGSAPLANRGRDDASKASATLTKKATVCVTQPCLRPLNLSSPVVRIPRFHFAGNARSAAPRRPGFNSRLGWHFAREGRRHFWRSTWRN